MAKTFQEKLLQTVTFNCQAPKRSSTHSKLTVKITKPQQHIKPHTIGKKTYNLRDRSKAEGSTDKVPTLSDSEKQQRNSKNTQHGRKNDDNKQ